MPCHPQRSRFGGVSWSSIPLFPCHRCQTTERKELHLFRLSTPCFLTSLQNHRMKNTNNTSIPIWVRIIPRQHHNITVSPRIKRVLVTAHVVCRVIYPQDFVSIDSVIDQLQRHPILICEFNTLRVLTPN